MVEINSKGVFAIKRLGAGSLEVFLARGAVNVDASQALRYCVFYEAMDAEPSAEMIVRRHDFDGFTCCRGCQGKIPAPALSMMIRRLGFITRNKDGRT